MSTPPNEDSITIRPVPQTNAYLAKYFDQSFGLFMRDVTDRLSKRSYKHIEIEMKPVQQITVPGRGSRNLNNCLILKADDEIKYENIPNLCDKFKIKKNLIKPIYIS